MSAVIVGVVAFVCIMGGTIAGLLLRNTLPDHHLSGDSRDAVKMGSGLIATLSALVLGLLVSSAKNSFDEMSSGITQGGAKLIMLDRAMSRYGQETQPFRQEIRHSVMTWVTAMWPEHKIAVDETEAFEKASPPMELLADKLQRLTPNSDLQRASQSEALQLCREILQIRWLMIEEAQSSLPPVFIGVLLLWLTILFASIGLLAPPNKTVWISLVICAISVSSAVFLVEEMNNPLKGIVKVSNAPIVKALEIMAH